MSLIEKMLLVAFAACSSTSPLPVTSDDAMTIDQFDAPVTDEPDAPMGPGVDEDGVHRIYPATNTPSIKLEYGARHENGDRYNANHPFINYEVTGYYLTANTEKIEMKTDGPNHSGCDTLPRCQWTEPRIDIAARAREHQLGVSASDEPSRRALSVVPGSDGLARQQMDRLQGDRVSRRRDRLPRLRTVARLDADNKPANHWVRMMIETNTGQVMPNPLRALPSVARDSKPRFGATTVTTPR